MSAKTTQLLSSGEFCILRYDTIPVKSGSANVSFYTNNSKMPNFELWHLSQMSDMPSNSLFTNHPTCVATYSIFNEPQM
jgi:hypothetical protein